MSDMILRETDNVFGKGDLSVLPSVSVKTE